MVPERILPRAMPTLLLVVARRIFSMYAGQDHDGWHGDGLEGVSGLS